MVLPLGLPALAGLFLVSVAPGAPLMTRGAAKRGFNMQMAASYQVWGALLTPLMIPTIASYALAAVLVMTMFAWIVRRGGVAATGSSNVSP